MDECPFEIGETVSWVDDAPETWRRIWTQGPMTVVAARYSDGRPSEYAEKYYFPLDFKPGWILEVEYDADSTDYYDPPLSVLFGTARIRMMVHQMWLRPLED